MSERRRPSRAELYDLWDSALASRVGRLLAGFEGLDDVDREDLLSETREHVARALEDREVDNLEAYAWTTAEHFVLRRAEQVRQRRQTDVPLEAEEVAAEPDEARVPGPEDILYPVIRELAGSLPEADQELLAACFEEGGSVAEAGRRLGIPRTTASSRLLRAIMALREGLLAKAGEDWRLAQAIEELWGEEGLGMLKSGRLWGGGPTG